MINDYLKIFRENFSLIRADIKIFNKNSHISRVTTHTILFSNDDENSKKELYWVLLINIMCTYVLDFQIYCCISTLASSHNCVWFVFCTNVEFNFMRHRQWNLKIQTNYKNCAIFFINITFINLLLK